jgi:ParB family chromosome partitioning protein
MGHARALLGISNKRKQAEVGALVAKKGLSVRDTEALVRRMQQPEGAKSGNGEPTRSGGGDPNVQRLEQELAEKLGAKVLIQHTATGSGKVVVNYNSLDELDGILAHIK